MRPKSGWSTTIKHSRRHRTGLGVEGMIFSQNHNNITSHSYWLRVKQEFRFSVRKQRDITWPFLVNSERFTRLLTNTPEQDRAQPQTLNSSYVNVRIVRENVADSDYWHEVQRRAGTLKISSEPKTMELTFLESASAGSWHFKCLHSSMQRLTKVCENSTEPGTVSTYVL